MGDIEGGLAMNGIDISRWDAGIDIKRLTTTDLVIVKATESTDCRNPYCKEHTHAVIASGKLLGHYHFARPGDAIKQADYFIGAIKGWLGRTVPFLDWEEDAVPLRPSWARKWLDRVYAKTGVRGGIYMSKSVCNAYDWSTVAKAGYALWVAQYPDHSHTGYRRKSDIWTDSSKFGAWPKWTIFQYSSTGRVTGYSGNLDLDYFDGTRADWQAWARGSAVRQMVTKVTTPATRAARHGSIDRMVDRAKQVAADDSHGYSQVRRWPSQGTDYDCSSLMYYCASYAGFDVTLGPAGTHYTGSMLKDFKRAGFKAIRFSSVGLSGLKRGDILLSVPNHTEMYIGGGNFVGAHSSETGGIDGKAGDQTGREVSVVSAYDYPWDYVLRPPVDGGAPTTARTIRYRVCLNANGRDWRPWRRDGYKTGIMGRPIRWIAIDGVTKYRVCTEEGGWLPWVSRANPSDLERGCAGDGSNITAIEIADGGVRYAAHNMGGGWNADMIGQHDTSGSNDTFAGAMVPIDRFWARAN